MTESAARPLELALSASRRLGVTINDIALAAAFAVAHGRCGATLAGVLCLPSEVIGGPAPSPGNNIGTWFIEVSGSSSKPRRSLIREVSGQTRAFKACNAAGYQQLLVRHAPSSLASYGPISGGCADFFLSNLAMGRRFAFAAPGSAETVVAHDAIFFSGINPWISPQSYDGGLRFVCAGRDGTWVVAEDFVQDLANEFWGMCDEMTS